MESNQTETLHPGGKHRSRNFSDAAGFALDALSGAPAGAIVLGRLEKNRAGALSPEVMVQLKEPAAESAGGADQVASDPREVTDEREPGN
ncbi:MAG TPA: hypothetical protein VFZ41_10245 [Solirubrobacterales bacterium]